MAKESSPKLTASAVQDSPVPTATHGTQPSSEAMPASRQLVLVTPENAKAAEPPNPKSAAWNNAKDDLDKEMKAFAPLKLSNLPDEVQRALAYIRLKAVESGSKPSAEMDHDVRILRFLIGQKWDVKAAGEHETEQRIPCACSFSRPRVSTPRSFFLCCRLVDVRLSFS